MYQQHNIQPEAVNTSNYCKCLRFQTWSRLSILVLTGGAVGVVSHIGLASLVRFFFRAKRAVYVSDLACGLRVDIKACTIYP